MDGVDPFSDKRAQRLTIRLDHRAGRFAGEAMLEVPGQSPRVRRFENIAFAADSPIEDRGGRRVREGFAVALGEALKMPFALETWGVARSSAADPQAWRLARSSRLHRAGG